MEAQHDPDCNRTYLFVAHGPDAVHFVEVPAGGEFMSGQPNIEEFNTEAEACTRALALVGLMKRKRIMSRAIDHLEHIRGETINFDFAAQPTGTEVVTCC